MDPRTSFCSSSAFCKRKGQISATTIGCGVDSAGDFGIDQQDYPVLVARATRMPSLMRIVGIV